MKSIDERTQVGSGRKWGTVQRRHPGGLLARRCCDRKTLRGLVSNHLRVMYSMVQLKLQASNFMLFESRHNDSFHTFVTSYCIASHS